MEKHYKNSISIDNMVIKVVFICLFILPIYFLENIGFMLDEFIFASIILVYYCIYLLTARKFKFKNLILVIIIIYFCIINRSFEYIHLIALIVIDKMVDSDEKIVQYIYNSNILLVSLFFVFIYTAIYFGYEGRYLYTGLKAANEGGLSLILLFLMIRTKYRKTGNVLLIAGNLTFSKSYLLGLCIFIFMSRVINSKCILPKISANILKNFKLLGICSVFSLILISSYFSNLYDLNMLQSYGQGIQRFSIITDYSNYFRFTANTNLLEIYKREPEKLLTGMSGEEFINYNRQISILQGREFRAIKPHNYFFSYMRIYGIFSLIIFWYLSTILKKVVVKDNLPVFLVIFAYITFLGLGVTSYWIFLSVFTMLFYNKNLMRRKSELTNQ